MKCMRRYCDEPRWEHPEKGRLCLCKEHAEEVFRGEAKAPPLRQNRDYTYVGRKTFLVDTLPGEEAMRLTVRESKYLKYTQEELDLAEEQSIAELNAQLESFRSLQAEMERLRAMPPKALYEDMQRQPLRPTGGDEPPRHEQILMHAGHGKIWVRNHGYMDESLWDDLVKWGKENAPS